MAQSWSCSGALVICGVHQEGTRTFLGYGDPGLGEPRGHVQALVPTATLATAAIMFSPTANRQR